MKKGIYSVVQLTCLGLITGMFTFLPCVSVQERTIQTAYEVKQLNSDVLVPQEETFREHLLAMVEGKEEEEPFIEEVPPKKAPEKIEVSEPVIEEEKEEPKAPEVAPLVPSNDVLETVVGTMSGYGPDCYGCTSNKTASGYYVGEGNITYQDATYGVVRILSGDRKYPFGTIVRIRDFTEEPILAIVLDRGGAVGLDKRIQFDLLYAKEKDAVGMRRGITFEVLRYGY